MCVCVCVCLTRDGRRGGVHAWTLLTYSVASGTVLFSQYSLTDSAGRGAAGDSVGARQRLCGL